MVKRGEFINFASNLKIEDNYSTTMQCVIELSKKVLLLEERILKLEEVKK